MLCNTVYLIELYKTGVRTPVAVSKHIKHCYSFATFIGEIAEPNQSYKLAVREIKLEGKTVLFDKSRFESVEMALHSKEFVLIRSIKYLAK